VPEGLLLVVWSSIGLWVVGWVGLWVQSFHSVMGWVGLGQSFGGLGWVEEIGPMDNSGTYTERAVEAWTESVYKARDVTD